MSSVHYSHITVLKSEKIGKANSMHVTNKKFAQQYELGFVLPYLKTFRHFILKLIDVKSRWQS